MNLPGIIELWTAGVLALVFALVRLIVAGGAARRPVRVAGRHAPVTLRMIDGGRRD